MGGGGSGWGRKSPTPKPQTYPLQGAFRTFMDTRGRMVCACSQHRRHEPNKLGRLLGGHVMFSLIGIFRIFVHRALRAILKQAVQSHCAYLVAVKQAWVGSCFVAVILGGSWYFVATYNCTYHCTHSHLRALKGLTSTVISTVWLTSTMNLQVQACTGPQAPPEDRLLP